MHEGHQRIVIRKLPSCTSPLLHRNHKFQRRVSRAEPHHFHILQPCFPPRANHGHLRDAFLPPTSYSQSSAAISPPARPARNPPILHLSSAAVRRPSLAACGSPKTESSSPLRRGILFPPSPATPFRAHFYLTTAQRKR